MDQFDRQLLDLLQRDFPITDRPYAALGEQVGLVEDEVVRRVQTLKDAGLIRRIGAVFEPSSLGYVSALVAAKVAPQAIERVAEAADAFPEVTHNYEREHAYDLWFAVIAKSEERIQEIVDAVRRIEGVDAIFALPALRRFKIQTRFLPTEAPTP
jgi:DNA-binding Lrp family transcriptional regulator